MSVLSALSHALRFGYVRGMYIFDMTHAVHAVSLEMMVITPLRVRPYDGCLKWRACTHVAYTCSTCVIHMSHQQLAQLDVAMWHQKVTSNALCVLWLVT